MDYARVPWTLFSFRSGMTKYDRRWRHSLCTIGVILSTNVITLEEKRKTETASEAQLKHWESKTPFPQRMEKCRLRMFLAMVVLPLLTVKGELSTWELEGLQREWSAGLSRSSQRAHWEAGFPPLFMFGEPSQGAYRKAGFRRSSSLKTRRLDSELNLCISLELDCWVDVSCSFYLSPGFSQLCTVRD